MVLASGTTTLVWYYHQYRWRGYTMRRRWQVARVAVSQRRRLRRRMGQRRDLAPVHSVVTGMARRSRTSPI